jgi:hypothetical protein
MCWQCQRPDVLAGLAGPVGPYIFRGRRPRANRDTLDVHKRGKAIPAAGSLTTLVQGREPAPKPLPGVKAIVSGIPTVRTLGWHQGDNATLLAISG